MLNIRILQSGMAKSGNYWLYRILQEAFARAGVPQRSFIRRHPIYKLARTWELSNPDQAGIDTMDIEPEACYYRISSVFRMPIADLDTYVRDTSHVWTHSGTCPRSDEVFAKFDKVVYIVRDPRDLAISLSRFITTPYMQTYYPRTGADPGVFLDEKIGSIARRWAEHLGGHLKREAKLHVIFYERLLEDFDAELTGLLDYLQLSLSGSEKADLRQAVRFSSMRLASPGHVRKGRAWQWVSQLTDMQVENVRKAAGPMLRYLGYPEARPPVGQPPPLPYLPARVATEDVVGILSTIARAGWFERMRGAYHLIRGWQEFPRVRE